MATVQKILIVDDKEENLFALEKLLRETGAEIIPAGNGNDALIASLNHDLSLAILDVQMPEMDGYELARYFREEEKTKDMPIIFLSAVYSDEQHISRGYRTGAVDFITKPYNPDIFLSKVNIFLHREKLLQEHKDAREELLRHRENLEELVKERTIELEERNKKLNEEIAERKRTEEINQLLASIVESSDDAIIGKTLDGKIFSWNRGARKVYGYEKSEIVGKEISIIAPSGYEGEWDKLIKTIKEGKSIEHYETQRQRKDGTVIHVVLTISPIRNASGELVGASTIARDITEHKQLENQIQQLQKMEALGRFAGGIAHDLNNILYPIILETEMLLEESAPNSPFSKTLNNILKAAHRQRDLIRQILFFGRKNEQKLTPITVAPLVEETLDFLRSTLPRTIDIKQHISAQTDMIMGDPTQIHQVIMNLFRNAADAIGKRNGTIEVKLENCHMESCTAHPELKTGLYLTLTVKDTGHGMRAEVMDKIFEPFFTTKEIGEGSGMGLSVVHGILKNHGGAIKVESKPEQGSEFIVFLPVTDNDFHIESQSGKTPHERGKGTILLIDDEEVILSSVKKALERLGYDVVAVKDAMEALEMFGMTPEKFNLVITDLLMPHITGVELAKKILAQQTDIPIILCTGVNNDIHEDEAKALGIRAVLRKPSGMSELKTAVSRVFENQLSPECISCDPI